MSTFLEVLVSGVMIGGVYAIIAVGVTLVFGIIHVVNFSQGEFVMYGAYFAYVTNQVMGLPLLLSIALAAPLAFVVGMALQKLLIEPLLERPLMQIFATFGVLLLMQNVALLLTDGDSKAVRGGYAAATFGIGAITISVPRLVVFVVATLMAIALVVYLRRTVTGTAIRAISSDKQAARLMGVNVERLYMVTMGIGIVMAVVAGVLVSPAFAVTPEFGFTLVLPAFVAAVAGGMGSIPGAYLAGLIVGVLETLMSYYFNSSLAQAATFLTLIVVLVVRPWGLLGDKAQVERMGAL